MACSGNNYFSMAEHSICIGMREVSWWAWEGQLEDSALEWSVGEEVAYQVRKCRAGSKMYENGKADGACLRELGLRLYKTARWRWIVLTWK